MVNYMIYCALGIPFIRQRVTLKKTFYLLGPDAEECHKQWLALGLISVLVSKVQSSKIIPLGSESDSLNSIDS